MNEIEKILNEKRTENGDKSYKSTGDNLTDLFFMAPYFEKNLDEVSIGTSEKEKVFSMFIRDPRFGLGRRDLGRRLMMLSKVSANNIIKAGRYDDLWHIPTDENLELLKGTITFENNELAKIDYFSQVAREREVQDLILEIEALVKENGFKEGK